MKHKVISQKIEEEGIDYKELKLLEEFEEILEKSKLNNYSVFDGYIENKTGIDKCNGIWQIFTVRSGIKRELQEFDNQLDALITFAQRITPNPESIIERIKTFDKLYSDTNISKEDLDLLKALDDNLKELGFNNRYYSIFEGVYPNCVCLNRIDDEWLVCSTSKEHIHIISESSNLLDVIEDFLNNFIPDREVINYIYGKLNTQKGLIK